MFARFCDQDHAFPACVLQGECDVQVNARLDGGEEHAELAIMCAPQSLSAPWCGAVVYLTPAEARRIARELMRAADFMDDGDARP